MTIAVSGRYAYVSDKDHLKVVDVSDPTNPRVVGSCEAGSGAFDVAVRHPHAYVATASLRVIDVSDPTKPKEMGVWRDRDIAALGVAVSGQYAFVAADIDGLRVVDVSDATAPREVAAFHKSSGATRVTVVGKHAYITGGEDAVALWIVDISDPKRPKEVGRYGDSMTGGVAVQDNYAYLGSGNLDVLDVSNPAVPRSIGSFDTPDESCGVAWGVAVAGDYVYALGHDGKQGFSILRADWDRKNGE